MVLSVVQGPGDDQGPPGCYAACHFASEKDEARKTPKRSAITGTPKHNASFHCWGDVQHGQSAGLV